MKALDISVLVKGLMAAVLFSMVIGHYDELERWARIQAVEALAWKRPLPYFFASNRHPARKDEGMGWS